LESGGRIGGNVGRAASGTAIRLESSGRIGGSGGRAVAATMAGGRVARGWQWYRGGGRELELSGE
jgi:hypothetical protein